MKIILIGYGTVGREVEKVLQENGIVPDSIIRSSDILDMNKVGSETYIFICVPSAGKGERIAHYYLDTLQRGARIITCEKAFLAHNWTAIEEYRNQIRYSATVGGDSGILPAVSSFDGAVTDIKAVVNGTLNYIGEQTSPGMKQEDIFQDVISKGFAEPGANNLEEVMEGELKDVLYKAVILANHSGMYDHIISDSDVEIIPYSENLRCVVVLTKGGIKAGFIEGIDLEFPSGADNAIYINGTKAAEGPGAGGRITALRMFKDFQDLTHLQKQVL